MNVVVNGESREVPEGLSVAALLRHLGIAADRVAIERNQEILSRAQWGTTPVHAGDRFEIVHFVGGGQSRCGPVPESTGQHTSRSLLKKRLRLSSRGKPACGRQARDLLFARSQILRFPESPISGVSDFWSPVDSIGVPKPDLVACGSSE